MITRKKTASSMAALLVAASLAACGASSDDSAETPRSDMPTGGQDSSTVQAVTPAAPFISSAADDVSDGAPIDLTEASLSSDGTTITATFSLADEAGPDASEAVGLFVGLCSPDGEQCYQIGAKWLGGRQIAHFVFDTSTAHNTDFGWKVDFADGKASVRVPADAIPDVGMGWQWDATVSVDTVDADRLPGEIGDRVTVD